MGSARVIERTCCVCRSKAHRRTLARLVHVGGELVWDATQKAAGRGAYVHFSEQCLSKMGLVSRWERALRLAPGSLVGAQVSQVARSLMQEVLSCLPAGEQTVIRTGGLLRGNIRR